MQPGRQAGQRRAPDPGGRGARSSTTPRTRSTRTTRASSSSAAPNLFSGYWPDGDGGPDDDGWFRTGDIAYADSDGDLFLVDRTKELILVSGFNVYPREVEEVLDAHPDVDEVAVIGVPHPYTGETVKALVVPRTGTSPSADELIEFAARRLARFKCPTSVEFVDQLPHSLTGKVAKGRLRDHVDASVMASADPRVVVVVTAGCHLCEDAAVGGGRSL